jgi:Cu(I)/Ag(I) efflux system protein CusF
MKARLLTLCAALLALGGPAAFAQPAQAPAAGGKAMPMAPPSGRTAKGTGVITAIDREAGTLTLKHQPIPALGWPAMTMDFKASPPALLTGLKIGQTIAFDANEGTGVPLVTAIRKR